jgi:hypothetical protein
MNEVPPGDATRRQSRHRAAVIEDPRIVVLECSVAADPDAVQDALELLVKWAVRAHRRCNAPTNEAAATPEFTARCAGEPT